MGYFSSLLWWKQNLVLQWLMKYGSIPLKWWWGLLMSRMATLIQTRQCSTMTPASTPERGDLLPAEWDVKAPHRWNTFLTQKYTFPTHKLIQYTFLTHQLTQDGVYRFLGNRHQAQDRISGWWKFPIIMQKRSPATVNLTGEPGVKSHSSPTRCHTELLKGRVSQ